MAISSIRNLFVKYFPSFSYAAHDVSYIDMLQGEARRLFGQLLNSLRIPGTVRDFKIADPVNNQIISISVGDSFTRISVNGSDYYFNRLTGKYEGKGTGWF